MRAMTGLMVALILGGCDDTPTEGGDGGLGASCLESTLAAQCPPGSNPILGATADSLCGDGADLMNMNGGVTGRCYTQGTCVVACQFAAPCACGVESVTREGVLCTPCEDVNPCGDGACAAGETPVSCPQDCAGECPPGAMRCQGPAIESCNLRGRWEPVACPQGEVCVQPQPADAPRCAREDIVVGRDGGVADGGGPRISGRLLLGDAEYPGTDQLAQPGTGRDLVRRGRFGLLRVCQGNAAQVDMCRTQVSATPRDELANPQVRGEVQVTMGPQGDHLRLWGTGAVATVGFDGRGPEVGERPTFEAFCAHHAEVCLGQPGGCDEAAAQVAWDAWTWGSAALVCWLQGAGCAPDDACIREGRLVGYDPGRLIERPDLGAFTPDGLRFAFWLDTQHVAIYDTTTRLVAPMGDVGNYVRPEGRGALAFSADGRFLAAVAGSAAAGQDGLVVVWSTDGGAPVAAMPVEDGVPVAVALSPGGALVAVMRTAPNVPRPEPAGVDVFNVASAQLLYRILPANEPNPPGMSCFSHLNRGLAFSPAGDRLAVGAQLTGGLACTPAAVVEIWNLATREKEQTLPGPVRGVVELLRYSPDGTTLAVASRQSQAPSDVVYDLSLWDAGTGALVRALDQPGGPEVQGTTGLSYSADGRFLITWGPGNAGEDFAVLQATVYGPEQP